LKRLLRPQFSGTGEEGAVRGIVQGLGVTFLGLILWTMGVLDLGDSLKWVPSYRPEHQVSGTIRVQGHESPGKDSPAELLNSWEEGVRKYHPDIRFENNLRGTASGIGGLYTRTAEVALMGREILPIESDGFEEVFHYKPLEVEVATTNPEVQREDFVPVVFVHKDNPISHLALTQLDAIFGAEHRRGSENIRTWGQLGLTGEWTEKPIGAYGFDTGDQERVRFFEESVMGGSRKWNCNIQEFSDVRNADGSVSYAGQRIVDALEKDRFGIAFSSLVYLSPTIKPLALGLQTGMPYFGPTKRNVFQRKYRLTRTISIFINRAPGASMEPKVKEFLRYILSREGQEAVARDGGYLPLNEDVVRRELEKLE
jgi:phosphate transport system substrate-binding protein